MNKLEERFPGNEIHETCIIYPGVNMGTGNEFGPMCIIGAPSEWKDKRGKGMVNIGFNNIFTGLCTIDSGYAGSTIIGNECFIMKAVHIGHNAHIHDKVTLSVRAIIGGHTSIGHGANIGLGAIIHQNHSIAAGCMIGMGAVVTKKLITEEYKTYVGNPARFLSDNVKHPNYPEYTINMKDTL